MGKSYSTGVSCDLNVLSDNRIIHSEPQGNWEADDVRKNLEDIKKLVDKNFGGKKWAFMAELTGMAPITDAETSEEFAKMHIEFEKENCVAIAFVVGDKISIKAQSQRHQDSSGSGLVVKHFRTKEEGQEWLATFDI